MTQKDSAEKAVRDIRRKTRRKFSAEEKIRIVLEGLRGEESIASLCRREGIAANLYYRWSKEFLEAGKKRLLGDTQREATSTEVTDLRKENARLKEVEGKEQATGEWMQIDQEIVDQFADVTKDHQFIHIDPERAKQTPFGGPIAHGFLTLSLLTHLGASANPENPDPARLEGMIMGVNYGFEKVRFISPVKVGS